MNNTSLLFLGFLSAVSVTFAMGANAPVPAPSAELGTLPPDVYIEDYYAPPPDFVPQREIRDYTLNTRVPDYFWLRYDGAYTLALRIRPIAKEKIEQEIAAKLIDPAKNTGALTFSPEAEKDEAVRSIIIHKLNEPADDFIELSFKVKAAARNAGANLKVVANGVSTLLTEKNGDPETKCLDGFKAYKITFAAKKGAVLRDIRIVADPASYADFEQEYVIFDLMFRRSAPKARFTDLPQRQWIRKQAFAEDRPLTVADGIADIRAFVDANPQEFPSLALPLTGQELRPQAAKDEDGGFKLEPVKMTLNGEEVDALRITLTHGPRCYLKFPIAFDATDYNTMTFFAQIQVPAGATPLLGDLKPMLWGTDAAELNRPFDTFGIGLYSATHDFEDWGRWGVTQATLTQNLEANAKVPEGWRLFGYDIINGAPTGNKSAFYPKLTHWTFYYDNKKIPEDQQVVVTIAAPKVTRGLMLAGGDIPAYKPFMAERPKWPLIETSLGKKAFEAPVTNRLDRPLPFVVNHMPRGAVYVDLSGIPAQYHVVVRRAVDQMVDLLSRKYATLAPIPVIEKRLPKDVANALIIGGGAFRTIDRECYDADIKALAGSPGCAIRSDGTNVYIYAAPFNFAGPARGLANGIYTFLENNTDVIFANAEQQDTEGAGAVFDVSPAGNFNIVWGQNYCNVPPLKVWGVSGVPKWHNDRNRAARTSVWGNWDYAGFRGRSCNHWWGYGTGSDGQKGEPNDTWGVGVDGKLMLPGCYTGHPCLIRVLEKAKEAYVFASGFSPTSGQFPAGEGFAWNSYDVNGLWVEDTRKVCQCAECATPIRLADGSTVKRTEQEFLSTQFYANGCAMINAVNVYARRDARIESIAYFWMTPVPRISISRNYNVRFCPYIRKDYFQPITAPINDTWWREMYRWSQMDVTTGLYEYFLYIQCRPWADVFKYDLTAEMACGLSDVIMEGDSSPLCMMERWVVTRLMWEPQLEVADLREYFLRRTFREASPDMEQFFKTFYSLIYRDYAPFKPMEFEDLNDFGRLSLRTKSAQNARRTVADDLTDNLNAAAQHVKNPAAAKLLARFTEKWDAYMAAARKAEGIGTVSK